MSHWWCCCPEVEVPPGPCTCDQCANNSAPCCWEVVLAGIVNDTCDGCDYFNGTWYIKQVEPGGCVWACEIDSGCTSCDTATLALTIADNKMTMTLGGHVWEKDFGETTPSCNGEHSLTHITSSGDCNTSSATCTISTFGEWCPCGCVPVCVFCMPHTLPPYLAIDVNEVEDTEHCDLCSFYENRTYLIPLDEMWQPGSANFGCSWRYPDFSNCNSAEDRGCGSTSTCFGYNMMTVLITAGSDSPGPGQKRVIAQFSIRNSSGSSITLAQYSLTWEQEDDFDCSTTDLTLTRDEQHYYCSWPETIRVYVPT